MTMDEKTQIEENIKASFLAVMEQIESLKKDAPATTVVDIERRCLALKYLVASKFDSEETAAAILSHSLRKYGSKIDDLSGINNYWSELQELNIKTENDPKEWRSSLTDPQTLLQYLKPLPCQTDNTLPCKNLIINDEHIKNLVEMWKSEEPERKRKLPKRPADSDTNLKMNQPIPKFPSHKTENINRDTQVKTRFLMNKTKFQNLAESRTPIHHQDSYHETVVSNPSSNPGKTLSVFKTARTELANQQAKKNQQAPGRRYLGTHSSVRQKFVSPLLREQDKTAEAYAEGSSSVECENESLRNIEPKLIEQITNEIMDAGTTVTWDDIAGLDYAKRIIQEVVVIPMLRPELFTGLRQPPKGILLFGPPGTGKTLIGKCIASQSKSTFFSISASSLTSKWIGEGEKLVRALFAVARVHQPSVVFIDEIDSLLSQRSESEHESSRRMKTEFLVQLDGAATNDKDRILILGATNRPYELDEAARRRLVKRLYIPLPEFKARIQIIENLLKAERHELTKDEIEEIARLADGYSGADMTNLCKEASMGPIRSVPFSQMENISAEDIRKITVQDFKEALTFVRPSVSKADLNVYIDWDRTYGSGTANVH